ncbi:MAG: alpha/beta hydrolase [Candidatus Obscuribacterales bacterium]|nr:alpha/beta hydrolase [Steroidobacteraceae bacterium]
MASVTRFSRLTAVAVVGLAAFSGSALAQQAHTLLGVNCAAPPAYHCPDTECLGSVVTQPGNTVEMKTRRTFFLDCPADYKPGDKVNVLMSLHGGGSYANWQRNYFPAMDVKDKHKLVIITPGSPVRAWSEADDEYLRNMVDTVVGAVGKENVQRFILAGHSQGGMTSNRIICTDYFKDKVDVRISLSGGRIGPTTPANRGFGAGAVPVYRSGEPAADAASQRPRTPPAAASGPAGGACDYSFIFAIGEYESIPGDTSPLADKFSCGKRVQLPDVIDRKQGYVWDSTRQDPGTDGWGHYPKSGRSQVFQFPNCKDGRVVADVVKLQKGHTEGYEPNITEKIIELAVSAQGGKIAKGSWTPPAPQPFTSPFGR